MKLCLLILASFLAVSQPHHLNFQSEFWSSDEKTLGNFGVQRDQEVSPVKGGVPVTFYDCYDVPLAKLKFTELTASTWPPKANEEVTLTVSAHLAEELTGGQISVWVEMPDKSIDMVAFDLCPTAHGYFSIGCPITPGDADLSAVLKFPAEMSAGDYSISVVFADQATTVIGCSRVPFSMEGEQKSPISDSQHFAVIGDSIPFTDCTGPVSEGKITALSGTPWPPVPGKPLTVTMTAELDETFTSGTFKAVLKWSGLTLKTLTGDLCKFSPDYPCPIKAGTMTASMTVDLPSVLPSGDYTLHFETADQTASAGCVDLDFKLSGESFLPSSKRIVDSIAAVTELKEFLEKEEFPLFLTDPRIHDTPVPFTSCAKSGAEGSVGSITASPWPPKAGEKLSLTVSAKLLEQVTSGSYTVKISYFGITLKTITGDICKATKCPRAAGDISFSSDAINLPSAMPHGKYGLHVELQDQDAQLVCLDISFHLGAAEVPSPSVPVTATGPSIHVPFTTCGSFMHIATVDDVLADVWPPVRGNALQLASLITSTKGMAGGTYTIRVSHNGKQSVDFIHDLCDLDHCPIGPGQKLIEETVPMELLMLPGDYVVHVEANSHNQKGEFSSVLCVEAKFTL